MSLQRRLEEAKKNLTSPEDSDNSILQEEVSDVHIAEIVSKWTGIPDSRVLWSINPKTLSSHYKKYPHY